MYKEQNRLSYDWSFPMRPVRVPTVTRRSDPVRLSAGETNANVDFGFYRVSCGDLGDTNYDGWLVQTSVGSGSCHELEMAHCSSWVKPFVCDVETDDPNKGIKITLPPASGDEDTAQRQVSSADPLLPDF
jgi:hypothetical protein